MYKFGEKSQTRLLTLHPDLQKILSEAIKIYDFSIIEGHRTLEMQQSYYDRGFSKLDGVERKSKHQSYPSMAVDIMPYKKGTNAFSGQEKDNRRFYFLMGIIKSVTERLYQEKEITHKVRFGIDWDMDDIYNDQSFDDMPHIELEERY
jgi:peptidoglycan L-alanyl-D-glutamate endopeptidase CwlK